MLKRTIRTEIEKQIGYRFKRRAYLEMALTHPSYRYEHGDGDTDNQRLEFLGDAALGLAAAAALYREHASEPEGTLTHLRSRQTNRTTLARIGRNLGLGHHLRLGRGEEMSGGRDRASNLADAVEALLGAVYLDGGQKAVDRIYARIWPTAVPPTRAISDDNPKGALQEYCAKQWKCAPTYRLIEEKGPAHDRIYCCEVLIRGESYGHGEHSSKRQAEAVAARQALARLEQTDTEK
jgi:ribonuclease III